MNRSWLLLGLWLMSARLGEPQTAGAPSATDIHVLAQRAEKGDAEAEYELGRAYQSGSSVQQNYAEAARWYRKAAEQGNTDARFSLAEMYFEGLGVAKNYGEAARWYGCGRPSEAALSGCKEIKYADLPAGAKALLKKLNCTVQSGENYDYGSAVDLNDDGVPEYQFCCEPASHGPCSAVLIGKVGSEWKDLTPKDGILGYGGACTLMIVLASKTRGFHDICLPNQCASPKSKVCRPTVLNFQSRYEASSTNSAQSGIVKNRQE